VTRFSREQIRGCLLGGAIGDAIGGIGERGLLSLSDDTQLTLATCESIVARKGIDAAHMAGTFLAWFRAHRITGIGSATLKAMRDLDAGASWALAGARGEMAAGNGAAMRIAPLAFVVDVASERRVIRDVARITHHNDEAYAGALAVLVAMQEPSGLTLSKALTAVADEIPDSVTRDRLREISMLGESTRIGDVAKRFGSSGYVAETVPLALFASWHMATGSFEAGLDEIATAGGDADTIGAIAGQLAGVRVGATGLPERLCSIVPERAVVEEAADALANATGASD
jgi:ADP-ribosyl-[dinitrogen reductase] hydrolase